MKRFLTILGIAASLAVTGYSADKAEKEDCGAENVYEFKVQDIKGETVDLSEYKGKVLLIVNVASKCGYTKQYADLVNLQEEYKDKDVVVMGFPANEFGQQEPGTNEEILEFCQSTFNVEFPMFSKVVVKGEGQAPLFQYLTCAANPDFTGEINWNFEKFLIGKDGKLLHRYRRETNPMSDEIRAEIDKALKAE